MTLEFPPPIRTSGEARAAIEEITLHSILNRFLSEKLPEWTSGDPKVFFSDYVSMLREKPIFLPKNETQNLVDKWMLPDGTQSLFLHSEPTILEAYLLFLIIMKGDSKVLQFDDIPSNSLENNFLPVESIRCIRDEVRTKRFIEGIRSAIEDKSKTLNNIVVCDAGCGALPILGLSALLQSEKTHVVFMENNNFAIRIAKELIKVFGLEDRSTFYSGDIFDYPKGEKFDVIISETMDSALLHEPQVQVMDHMADYAADGAITIPQRIKIFLQPIALSVFNNTDTQAVVEPYSFPVIENNWIITGDYIAGKGLPSISAQVCGSEDFIIAACCELDIYKDIVLLKFESKITMPVLLSRKVFDRDKPIDVSYVPGCAVGDVHISLV